jgi:hypothetical protein
MNIFVNGRKILEKIFGVDNLNDVKINTVKGNHGTTIVINGQEVAHEGDSEINIEINGNINHFNLPSGNVTVNGDVKTLYTMSGNVVVNNGDVSKITTTSGNVTISGNCTDKISTTSGNVTIGA